MEEKFVKANELLESPAFLEQLKQAENHEEVQALFAQNGVALEIADIELMCKVACENSEGGELSEDELSEVSGGVLITASAAACFMVGSAMLGFFTSYGYRTAKDWAKDYNKNWRKKK